MNNSRKGDYFNAIMRSKQTVFTFKELALIWGEPGSNRSRVRINYYVKNGKLLNLRRGIYAKDKNYDRYELATKIFIPSYISFETVLTNEGIIFQYYAAYFVASYLSRKVTCDDEEYHFRRIKKELLTNHAGIVNTGEYYIATKERAFLDMLYASKNYYFDNLSSIDWKNVFAILPIYNNKRMEKIVRQLFKQQEND